MSAKIALLAGVLVVALAGSFLVYRSLKAPVHSHASAAPAREPLGAISPSDNAEMKRLRADFRLLQGQLSGLRDDVQQKAAAPAAALEPAPPTEPQDAASIQAGRAEADRQWKEHMAEVAAEFEQETYDRNFATRAKSALDESFRSNPTIQAVASEIDCRSRTCRIEVKNGRDDAVAHQLPLFLMSLQASLPNMQADTSEQDGKLNYVLYLTNEQQTASAQATGR